MNWNLTRSRIRFYGLRLVLLCSSLLLLSGASVEQKQMLEIDKAFADWQKTPAAAQADGYLNSLQPYSQQKLSLFELTYNRHPAPANCPYALFAIPPKKQWKNLRPALQILNVLQAQNIVGTVKMISVYRDPTANACVHGSKASRHMLHKALDFQVALESAVLNGAKLTATEANMCQFWRKKGRALNMGLGVYGQNRFHIDATGYRTWGAGLSPCVVTVLARCGFGTWTLFGQLLKGRQA